MRLDSNRIFGHMEHYLEDGHIGIGYGAWLCSYCPHGIMFPKSYNIIDSWRYLGTEIENPFVGSDSHMRADLVKFDLIYRKLQILS